jgi:hypothetical protein
VTSSPTPDPSWIWDLAARDPEALYNRLLEHDAIHLQARVPDRVAARHYLLDAERVFRRAAARLVYAAVRAAAPSPEDSEQWLSDRIDEAIDDCLRLDGEAHRQGKPAAESLDHYAQFHWSFMVPRENTLAVSVAFNSLEPLVRRSFYELLVEQRGVAECLERGLGPAEDLRRRVQRALDAATGVALGHDSSPD